ncbi:hypothetical protein SNEBB_010183 [Seison nebaliae]|nr:hypothetical protein SNEBB_010183 [Seison nebaliae]
MKILILQLSTISIILTFINCTSWKDERSILDDFIRRRLGDEFVDKFQIVLRPQPELNDYFTFYSKSNEIGIVANNVLSCIVGINHYMKYHLNQTMTWAGESTGFDVSIYHLPYVPFTTIQIKEKYRYYLNICTLSYSTVWWNWERWEREIDWMAMNGINLVLVLGGTESIWNKVFIEFGLSQNEIDEFLSGPAFLAWHRMGNLHSYATPLSSSWKLRQIQLQKLIMKRLNEFGINPVLPAFPGFVPQQMLRHYPSMKVSELGEWAQFECEFSCSFLVDPNDEMFLRIGKRFVELTIEEFGTSNYYSCDVFNEMTPTSSSLSYLKKVNEAIYNSIQSADPKAIWVMQAWVFLNPFWNDPERVRFFLSGIPKDRLILLDLAAEEDPQYVRYESFFGYSFIWNMLHDFGGTLPMHGNLKNVNDGLLRSKNYNGSSMIGIGTTMEGINQNEIMYDFLYERAFLPHLNEEDMRVWVTLFTQRRYGRQYELLVNAWHLLYESVYSSFNGGSHILWEVHPTLNLPVGIGYNVSILCEAWDKFYLTLNEEGRNDKLQYQQLYQYDVVDVTKEVLRAVFSIVYDEMIDGYKAGDLEAVNFWSHMLLEVISDADKLLGSAPQFLYGKWLEDATKTANNSEEGANYRHNARLQVTTWGYQHTRQIRDYASKSWSGLLSGYYFHRWQLFVSMLETAVESGVSFNQNEFEILSWNLIDEPFLEEDRTDVPSTVSGDFRLIASEMYEKYRYIFLDLNW